jgi:hyperosmotically inducible protein
LYGQVVRPTLRSGAEREVKKIEGVERVTNRIEVLPASFFDDRLRVQLYRTIYSDSMLSRYALQSVPPIHIIVKNGHVTLEGVVASESERNLAALKANSVPLTFSVQNNLRVEG